MKRTWNINVWGVRGSFPVPDVHFLTYGGNTSCISAEYGERLIVFDAGSGLLRLGESLAGTGKKRVDILLSHLHLDHVSGLFGFKPLYDRDMEIHLYGGCEEKGELSKRLEILTGHPYWPVGLQECFAHIEVHEIYPGEKFFLAGHEEQTGDVRISTLRGKHPDQSILYRAESKDKAVVYALDCEMDEEMFLSLKEFSKGSDLIIWDASFTREDLNRHTGWGHSSWEQGIALCREADIKKILMTHYSPEYPDSRLKTEEEKAKKSGVMCYFAKEGMGIEI